MRLIFGFLLWWIYMPLVRMMSYILFFNPKVRSRYQFEKKNKFEYLAQSFKEWNEVADLCFEFSSEGEYQQVAPLIQDALYEGKKIELVFFSPSVERAIMILAEEYPRQIRYLRFPMVRIFPFMYRRSFNHWVSAKTLILVRYDLLPEILYWSMKKGNELRMVWVTFKKERSNGAKISLWKKLFLYNTKKVIFSGARDLADGKSLGVEGHIYDFRIEQINRRLELREDKFLKVFPAYIPMREFFKSQTRSVILGNAWPSDLMLLKNLPQDVAVLIVPHDLSAEIIKAFQLGLEVLGRKSLIYTDGDFVQNQTIILNKKGVLCELYADFDYAYVGGGFEGSIHSVLEPLVSGSLKLSCGPKHHRSTEYDLALDMERIIEVNTPEEFMIWLNTPAEITGHGKIKEFIESYGALREFVISC